MTDQGPSATRLAEIRQRAENATDVDLPDVKRASYDHGGGRMFVTGDGERSRQLVLDVYEAHDREFYFRARQDMQIVLAALSAAEADRDAYREQCRLERAAVTAANQQSSINAVRAEQAEARIIELETKLQREEHAHGETIDQRDRAESAADKLAYAIADVDTIGEHSNLNDPWANALDELATIQDRAEAWEVLNRCRDLDQKKVAKLTAAKEQAEARITALEAALRHLAKVFTDAEDDDNCDAVVWAQCVRCGTEVGWPIDAEGWPPEPICAGCLIAAALSSSVPADPERPIEAAIDALSWADLRAGSDGPCPKCRGKAFTRVQEDDGRSAPFETCDDCGEVYPVPADPETQEK